MQPLSTQIVGSYTKPHWLTRHGREHEFDNSWWRPEAEVLEAARQDATLLSIYEQERAGLDVVTDGEASRVHYDRHFLAALGGVDVEKRASKTFVTEARTSEARADLVDLWESFQISPTITGPLEWMKSAAVEELRFLKQHATHLVKTSIVGPMTLYDRLIDEHYATPEEGILALAGVLNQELRAIQAEGVDLIQIAEPAIHFKLARARELAPAAVARMVEGITTPLIVHVCYGYAMYSTRKSANPSYGDVVKLLADMPVSGMSIEYEQPGHQPELLRHAGDKHVHLGLLDLGTHEVETPEHIAGRLRGALDYVPAERLHASSDCGMWFLPREVARGKIQALVAGTNIVRRELGLEIPEYAQQRALRLPIPSAPSQGSLS